MIFEQHQLSFLKQIGDIFKQFRLDEGLTHKEARLKTGMSTAKISKLENARSDICLLSLQKWAHAYGYDLEISFVPIEEEILETTP